MSKRWTVVLGAFVLAVSGLIAPPAGAVGEPGVCQPEQDINPPSPVFVVPDVSHFGPGAYVSWVKLYDGRNLSHYERPTGSIVHPSPSTDAWRGVQICVEVPNHQPAGEVLLTNVEGRLVGLFGYAYDVDTVVPPYVYLKIDGRRQPQWWRADRPWVSTPTFAPEATDRSYLILVPDVPSGEHEFCVYAEDDRGGVVNVGCKQIVVK